MIFSVRMVLGVPLAVLIGCTTVPKKEVGLHNSQGIPSIPIHSSVEENDKGEGGLSNPQGIPPTPIRFDVEESAKPAFKFCQSIEDKARSSSSWHTLAGWGMAVPAAVSLFYAGQVGTDPTHKTFVRRNPGMILTVTGTALGALSLFFFSRSDAATTASAKANTAMATANAQDAYIECVAAKSAWIESRKDANAFAAKSQGKASDETLEELTTQIKQVASELKDIKSTENPEQAKTQENVNDEALKELTTQIKQIASELKDIKNTVRSEQAKKGP